MALIRKRYQAANGPEKFLPDPPRGRRIIFRDVFPNFGDVLRGEWMKGKAMLCVHCGGV